jgi:3-dehydroquinate synthase
MPTTLLAQTDASVGGKTAVNHPRGKNLIGAFHQPLCVVTDTDTLVSLPERELRAGLAEIIKYGLIRDEEFVGWLESRIDEILELDSASLGEAIERSCRHKAEIVAEDEREHGVRALLNFGHTFAHAIETATGYSEWLHGEAVGLGMRLAGRLSAQTGTLASAQLKRLEDLLDKAGLPDALPPGLDAGTCLELMGGDKKVRDGVLRLVLLRDIGEAFLTSDVDSRVVRDVLEGAQCS